MAYCGAMTKVSASILSADFSRLGAEMKMLEASGSDWAHVDVMDGMFVPNITIGPSVIKAIRKCTSIPFDVHLMIQRPERYVTDFIKAGADYLTVHPEAEGDPLGAMGKISDAGAKAGISINPETDVKVLDKYLDKADLVLIMTVHPGFGGQSFIPSGVEKIRYVRKWADEHNPKLEISVDGGINRSTGAECVRAGATVLAAGSALFGLADMSPEIRMWQGFGPDP
ncbi:MAG: ribulose-phosphate 3-epimerase [Candidatus Methanomethylophilaceae archaeon]|nr:ribulose-phosphate 3-epimerase [Candidatus Methanomethylophilaceae archaeon]MDY0252446.1 ribulose-phosphate 3-epimerase [Candidatus Methanomethylophilaceae archaeon]